MSLSRVVPFIVLLVLDLFALAVSALAGFFAMPLGAVYGSVFLGATIFTLTWRTLGNSRDFYHRMYGAKSTTPKDIPSKVEESTK
jgi:uncharacterized membrane protein AbrB (regulator of aidB expression)